ncbi:Transcriptional regulator, IclR family [Mycetocola reblochoni REB411]|uniref:Transcriptional regulator, IclR family n=1 Tax=Mycetocola reblochoni REB411 TaxID=1255698 RepID=A0A1R4IGZ5_9MICO|nr:Transcriptional regulator, IclR family [Mycetocola reblochoni REB411]
MLANAAALVELLAVTGPLNAAAIAERLGVARSSVYRLVEGATAIGFTETSADARVGLTTRFLRLADAAAGALTEWSGAERVLQRVADRTHQTVFLSVLRGDESVCVAWARGRGIDLLSLRPGRALPLYAGAAGRSILAQSSDALDDVLAGAPFEPFTAATLTSAAALADDVRSSREQGFTLSDEDVTAGIGAIAVPIPCAGAVASISAGGLAEEIRADREDILVELRRAALDLAAVHGRDRAEG